MKRLRNLLKRFETVMTAETFAEAGEFETAREIMQEEKEMEKRDRKQVDRDYRTRLILTKSK